MNISPNGLAMIKSFEGLLKKLPDGRYQAYSCPAGVWTVYAGCTEGVFEGMIVTEMEGETLFLKELEKHQKAVTRLVTVDLNQNQYDSLVSFSFNVGFGALGKSTLLKKLNKGDYPGAQAEFMKWNKAGGKQLRGLSNRRAKEAALFAEKDEGETVMAQAVDPPKEPVLTPGQKMGLGLGAGAGVPAIPSVVTDSIGNAGAWKSAGDTVLAFGKSAIGQPLITMAVIAAVLAICFAPKLLGRDA